MPAKKIIEAVASTLAVIGSSMATVPAGPMPGSTPTAVPSAQPTKAHSRLIGVPAVKALHQLASRRPWLSQPPALVRPGRLMARNFVNIQYTGAAISNPVTSWTQVLQAVRRLAFRVAQPRTASTSTARN
jgi:hypothetical protein